MHTIIIDLYIEHKSFLTSISSFSSPSINQGTGVNGSYKRIRCMSYIHVVDGIHFSKCGVNGRWDGLLELMTKIIGGSLIVLHHNSLVRAINTRALVDAWTRKGAYASE